MTHVTSSILGAAMVAATLNFVGVSATQQANIITTLAVPARANTTPWIATRGNFVAVAWGASADGKADIFTAISRDGGVTFDAPVRVNTIEGEARLNGELPPRVELPPSTGGAPQAVIVAWNAKVGSNAAIRVARSDNTGRTFQPATTMQSDGATGERGWHSLALDNDGSAHMIWLDHRRVEAHKPGAHSGQSDDGTAMAQGSSLYYRNLSAAQSAERELLNGVCYCCKTALVAANGKLFAAWRHVYPGSIRDIAFVSSPDGGRTFTAPQRVSEDNWLLRGCPDDGPAMAVDQQGRVHIVWPTVIGGDKPEGALFYASTIDGRTFSARQRIPTLGSPKPSHPQITIDRNGQPVVAWDEVMNGVRRATLRRVTINPQGAPSFGEPVAIGDDTVAAYPVLATTNDALIAVWTRGTPGTTVIGVQRIARD